jgi:hypothetical protein
MHIHPKIAQDRARHAFAALGALARDLERFLHERLCHPGGTFDGGTLFGELTELGELTGGLPAAQREDFRAMANAIGCKLGELAEVVRRAAIIEGGIAPPKEVPHHADPSD